MGYLPGQARPMSHRGLLPSPPKRGQLAFGLGIDGLDFSRRAAAVQGDTQEQGAHHVTAGDTAPARVMAARMCAGRRYPRVRMNGRPWCAAA